MKMFIDAREKCGQTLKVGNKIKCCFTDLKTIRSKKYILKEWNVTPLIRRGSNFYFFVALYFALLDLLP